jgi:putative tricarboxylic transport membrane protein
MFRTGFIARVFIVLACAASAAGAAEYPQKPVEMVVAGAPGGGLDLLGRAMDAVLHEAKLLNQPFVIKNMGGAGGNVAKSYTHQRKGDPYTIYVESNRIYIAKIVGTTELNHNDVTPLGRVMTEYLVWAVRADSPFKTARDVLDKLKSNPASIAFGVGTTPSNDQMHILRPAIAQGVAAKQVRIVTFKAGGDLMIQLLGGHVDVISTGFSEAIEQAKAGKVRLIAISSPSPVPGEFAKVPTWKSMGMDVTILHWRGVFGPPGMPADAVKYWDATLAKMVKTDSWKKYLEKYEWFDAYADSATFAKDLRQENDTYVKILTELGMAKAPGK